MDALFSFDQQALPASAEGKCLLDSMKRSTGSFMKATILCTIDSGLSKLSRSMLSTSWTYLIPAVKSQISQVLRGATIGSLTIVEGDESTTFGNSSDHGPHVVITVLSEQFWVRLMLVQDLGFAEAYMAGEITVNSLVDFVRFYIYNRDVLDSSNASPIVTSLMYLANTRFGNSLLNSTSNISAHYDLGNEMFEMFLDATMTYSCGIWAGPDDTLEAAQIRKLDMLIDKAHLRPTDYVLDLGCGWGSLSMRAVERTGCRVLGITLSTEQKEIAEQRIAQAGMSDRIEIKLIDYRNLDPAEYQFDKIISLEMVEHCSRLLSAHHGVMVLQASTMNEERYEAYKHSVDFINKHIFPGGHCPSVSALVSAATKGSKGSLMLESAANFPDHYARTLRAWRERFLHGYDKVLSEVAPKNPQLILQERDLNTLDASDLPRSTARRVICSLRNKPASYNDVFRRKWEYYFAYCEGAFATRTIGCTQLVFTRTYNEHLSDLHLLRQWH
ncbi:cyclopropane-fatty-acyl-phospholipid synthase [Linderina pennispora]|uniref:Cyclopropane-fatty-acyl-phospholipid synthase n=1 Tax=Linderina pennispora TaxID=61395 RepID=A0A1Y1WBA3_9FUNG|nr:cyclopropane-fatty-acyl-phospholipid synthase [Linderina pennispora]ORX70526.1 cyclopropane-fatty-acyl-phospholipid synthase [Linderina pennispora]